MNTRPTRPLVALSGALFAVLGIIATIVVGETPDFVDDADVIAAFYVENSDDIIFSDVLYLLSGAAFLVFAGFLRQAARLAEGGDGRLATTGYGGAIAGVTLMLAAAGLDAVAALRVDDQGAIDPATATVFWDAGVVLWGLAAPIAFSVLVLTTAALSISGGLLPAGIGWLSVILGIALLVPPISWLAMIVFVFWVLVVSIVLYLRPAPAVPPTA